jgi:hypothetical protein
VVVAESLCKLRQDEGQEHATKHEVDQRAGAVVVELPGAGCEVRHERVPAVDAEADWRSKPKGNTTSQSQTRKLSQDFIKELQLQIQLVSTRFE